MVQVTLIQAAMGADILLYLSIALEVYKFMKRVRGKLGEPAWSPQSTRAFQIWTWMTLMPGIPGALVLALLSFVLTRDIMTSLVYFALMAGLVVFVWLIPFTVPAAEETIRKKLE